MKHVLILAALALLFACQDSYHTIIFSRNDETGAVSADTVHFKEENDTAAFKEAVEDYWIHRVAALKTNKILGRAGPVARSFLLMDKDWEIVTFAESEKERLASSTVNYYRDTVIPSLDTITPYRDRPQEKQADIYK